MAHPKPISHLLLHLCLIALSLGSFSSLAKEQRCEPLELLDSYGNFMSEIADLPTHEASSALIKSTWLTFESKVAEDASKDHAQAQERFEFTLNTVGLLLADSKYDGSPIKTQFELLMESNGACKHLGAEALNAQNLLTIRVSEEGFDRIGKEVNDVKEMGDEEYRHANQLLLNIALRLRRFSGTQHYRDIEGKFQRVRDLEDAKASERELKEAIDGLKRKVKIGDRWASIENKDLQEILNHVQNINDLTKSIKQTPEYGELQAELDRAMKTHEIQVVKQRYQKFIKTSYASRWRKELNDVLQTFEKEMKLEDVPFDLQLPETKDITEDLPDFSSDDE